MFVALCDDSRSSQACATTPSGSTRRRAEHLLVCQTRIKLPETPTLMVGTPRPAVRVEACTYQRAPSCDCKAALLGIASRNIPLSKPGYRAAQDTTVGLYIANDIQPTRFPISSFSDGPSIIPETLTIQPIITEATISITIPNHPPSWSSPTLAWCRLASLGLRTWSWSRSV